MIRDNGQPITIYGTAGCAATRRARAWFDERGYPYRYVDIDADRGAEPLIRRVTDGRRDTPVITFPDGAYLVAPAPGDLAAAVDERPWSLDRRR